MLLSIVNECRFIKDTFKTDGITDRQTGRQRDEQHSQRQNNFCNAVSNK